MLYAEVREHVFPALPPGTESASSKPAAMHEQDSVTIAGSSAQHRQYPQQPLMRAFEGEYDDAPPLRNLTLELPMPTVSHTAFMSSVKMASDRYAPNSLSLKRDLVARCRRSCNRDIQKRRNCPRRRQVELDLRRIATQEEASM